MLECNHLLLLNPNYDEFTEQIFSKSFILKKWKVKAPQRNQCT